MSYLPASSIGRAFAYYTSDLSSNTGGTSFALMAENAQTRFFRKSYLNKKKTGKERHISTLSIVVKGLDDASEVILLYLLNTTKSQKHHQQQKLAYGGVNAVDA